MHAFTLLTSAAFLLVPVPDGNSTKQDIQKLIGSWKVVTLDDGNGAQPLPVDLGDTILRFTEDTIFVEGTRNNEKPAAYKIDAGKNPKEIDLTPRGEKTFVGIYMIEKETLTICMSEKGPRPKTYKGDKATKTAVITLKRVNKK